MDAPLVWPLTDFGEAVLRPRPGGITKTHRHIELGARICQLKEELRILPSSV